MSSEVITENKDTEKKHHHHHHHHHNSSSSKSSDGKKKKRKDATGEYRKRMFTHVERMLFVRRWSFAILTVAALVLLSLAIAVYVLD